MIVHIFWPQTLKCCGNKNETVIKDLVNKTGKEKVSDKVKDRCRTKFLTTFDIKPLMRGIIEIVISHKDSKSVLICCDGR